MLGVASGLGAAGASVGVDSNKSKIKNIYMYTYIYTYTHTHICMSLTHLWENKTFFFAAPIWRMFILQIIIATYSIHAKRLFAYAVHLRLIN